LNPLAYKILGATGRRVKNTLCKAGSGPQGLSLVHRSWSRIPCVSEKKKKFVNQSQQVSCLGKRDKITCRVVLYPVVLKQNCCSY